MINFSNVKKFYKELDHQKKAIIWLGSILLETPAKSKLNLSNASDWIERSDEDLEWLKLQLSDKTLNTFITKWHDTSELDKEKRKLEKVDWTNMKSHASKYFTVGEFLRFDSRRIPTNPSIIKNLNKLAIELDKVREAFGAPLFITSGYRDPITNQRVGGVRNSQHLYGLAVDIRPVQGNIYSFQSWLDRQWYGRLGYGAKKGFVHIDMKNNKGWLTGGSKGARWDY